MILRARGGCRAIFGTLGLAVAVTGAGGGCGGGGGGNKNNNNYPDSSVHFDSGTGGSNADAGTRPIPPVGDGVTTLASGAAFLVGFGDNSCTNQDPPSGDRWCAFTMPSATFLGGNDLWVIDVTKAAAGTSIRCDVSDLNCLQLTSTLYTGDLTIHGFFGDTLIYYADVGQTAASAYGWRPGMTSARRLSTNAPPNGCLGHPTTDAVRCLQNQDSTTVSGQTTFDLTAGYLTVGGNAPLPKVATIIAQLGTDPVATTGVTPPARFRTSFSADGVWLAWSARPSAADTETLMVQKIGDSSTRVTVASDVSRWTFSRDGKTLYWLKSFNYDPAAPLGTLQSTAFPVPPSGTAPTVTTIQPNVSFYNPAGDTGLILLGASTNGAAQLSVMADSAQPSQAKVLDDGVTQVVGLSLDGHDILYAKTGLDLYANGLDLSTACTLTTTAAGSPFGTFTDPPGLVFWAKPDATVQNYDGMYTNLTNCQSQQFTNGFIVWNAVKDQGLIYGDDAVFDTLGNVDVTLRYSSLTSGAPPASGTAIQQRANPTFGMLLPYLSAVVYTVNTGGDTDGIYLKGDLPFPATTPPAPPLQHPDSGVGPGDGGADGSSDVADASDGG